MYWQVAAGALAADGELRPLMDNQTPPSFAGHLQHSTSINSFLEQRRANLLRIQPQKQDVVDHRLHRHPLPIRCASSSSGNRANYSN
jgi:hypothetical protein